MLLLLKAITFWVFGFRLFPGHVQISNMTQTGHAQLCACFHNSMFADPRAAPWKLPELQEEKGIVESDNRPRTPVPQLPSVKWSQNILSARASHVKWISNSNYKQALESPNISFWPYLREWIPHSHKKAPKLFLISFMGRVTECNRIMSCTQATPDPLTVVWNRHNHGPQFTDCRAKLTTKGHCFELVLVT